MNEAIVTTLAVRQAIRRQTDELIRAATRNVAYLQGTGMEENQIRNVMNLAAATLSSEEVTNFIRYQIGRSPRNWEDFGKAVIKDIETGAIKKAMDEVMKAAPSADAMQVKADLISRYLAYLNRRFIYAKKTQDWGNLNPGSHKKGETA
jgi:hypothetical protein